MIPFRRRRPEAAADARSSDPQREVGIETLAGIPIVVLPGVFNGIRHHTGAFLAQALDDELVSAGTTVLDLGTGSGVCAVFAARRGANVIATDINDEAVRCARINILAHHLEGRAEARAGDLFAPVAGERFDLILWNPPYFVGTPADAADRALRSGDAVPRFLRGFAAHLTPGGRALIVLSPDTDVEALLLASPLARVAEWRAKTVLGKRLVVYDVRPR